MDHKCEKDQLIEKLQKMLKEKSELIKKLQNDINHLRQVKIDYRDN